VKTETDLFMRAPAQRIYALAADVLRWPELLPHYRWVTLLERKGETKLVEMAARRGWVPVRWQAVQQVFPEVPRITFRHVGGVTNGMDVEWSFHERADGTLVRIEHQLSLGWPLIGRWAADDVIGPHFVEYIARRTLRCFRDLAERQ
jgi:ribosome-associated toxin RatA of RatAB toxin-antitoxin module